MSPHDQRQGSNYEIANSIYVSGGTRSFKLYLRSESLKKLINPNYIQDKSYATFTGSKFHPSNVSYSEYVCESLDKNISYSEYLSEQLHGSVSYSEYLAEKI